MADRADSHLGMGMPRRRKTIVSYLKTFSSHFCSSIYYNSALIICRRSYSSRTYAYLASMSLSIFYYCSILNVSVDSLSFFIVYSCNCLYIFTISSIYTSRLFSLFNSLSNFFLYYWILASYGSDFSNLSICFWHSLSSLAFISSIVFSNISVFAIK